MRSCVNLQYASIASSNAPHFANVYASDHSFSDFDPCGFKGDLASLVACGCRLVRSRDQTGSCFAMTSAFDGSMHDAGVDSGTHTSETAMSPYGHPRTSSLIRFDADLANFPRADVWIL